ncbi:unnamed protein product [Schistocephalus solidus]|uniref:Guanylate cyclase domain-containing protein n=1 Tax=Schistocephalus solidus TaxID=70667 RepID=A0A0X3PNV7_SCHSO|nr:unnamed protein product [Schistocephalus solidus]
MSEVGSQPAVFSGAVERRQEMVRPMIRRPAWDSCNSAANNAEVGRRKAKKGVLFTHPSRWFIPTPPFRRSTVNRQTPLHSWTRKSRMKEVSAHGNVNNEVVKDPQAEPNPEKSPRITLPVKSIKRQSSFSLSIRAGASPRRMNNQGGKTGTHIPSAFSRLLSLNTSERDTDGLGDLPGPGELEPIRVGQKYLASSKRTEAELSKRTRTICFFGSLLALFLILIEIIFMLFSLGMGKPCDRVSSLIVSVSLLAICIIIVEWIKSWLFREASPMWLVPQKKSTIAETNAHLVMLASALQAPVTSGPLSPINQEVGTNKSGAFDRPKLEIHDVLKSEPEDVYEGGGGFRGRIADYRRFDVARCIASLFLLILYIVAGVLLLRGLVTTVPKASVEPKSASNTNEEPAKCAEEYYRTGFTFVVFNLAMIGLRAVLFLTSKACKGLLIIFTRRNKSENEVSMVTNNTLNGFLPHIRKHDAGLSSQDSEE